MNNLNQTKIRRFPPIMACILEKYSHIKVNKYVYIILVSERGIATFVIQPIDYGKRGISFRQN